MTGVLRISIDGPTGSGKTTLGSGIASHFDTAFLDTGLTYRALAFLLTIGELGEDDSWSFVIRHVPARGTRSERVFYRSEDITSRLWGQAVDASLDVIARNAVRRRQILAYHHKILDVEPRAVVAGRDVAVTLLETAVLHVFLTADLVVRRERKNHQHGQGSARRVTVGAITERDLLTLEECRKRRNCIILDTTHIPAQAILGMVVSKVFDLLSSQALGESHVF